VQAYGAAGPVAPLDPPDQVMIA